MANILIIDDNDQLRKVIQEILRRAGHNVISVANGQDGIDAYRKEPTDLVITDLIMPVMSGEDVIRELLKDFPNVKIITFTGGDLGSENNLSEIPNVKYSFRKPFRMKEIREAVKEIVG